MGKDGKKEDGAPLRWLGRSQLLGQHRDGPEGLSRELQEPQSAMEMVISMCFTCVLHMTRCLRVCSGSLGASWELSA